VVEGTTIGQYRLVRTIGAGGMGVVYLAEHALIGRRAAIKVLLPELSMNRDIVSRFFNEAKAMASISDPGIVQMFDFGFHTDGCAYIVMELLEGESLGRRLKRMKRFGALEALRIVRQVAGSLQAAHERGVVHRDLKPDNVFIVRDGESQGGERAKVLDFGIAKLGDDTQRDKTIPGTVLGTPAYMSPEQCRGIGVVDSRSDIYSLGCLLFFLVTGKPPFDHRGAGELISAHLKDPPSAPSTLTSDLPAGLDELVLHCLEKSPDDRFQTMTELQSACDKILAQLSSGGQAPGTGPVAVALPTGFRSAAGYAGEAATTLSSAVGVTGPNATVRRRWIGVAIGIGASAIVFAGIALIVVFSGGSKQLATPPPVVAPVVAPVVDAVVVPVAAPPPDARVDAGVDAAVKKVIKRPEKHTDDLYDDR
jgi:tRNA A-37 threonylcarbamoyl transferase component Bud32